MYISYYGYCILRLGKERRQLGSLRQLLSHESHRSLQSQRSSFSQMKSHRRSSLRSQGPPISRDIKPGTSKLPHN